MIRSGLTKSKKRVKINQKCNFETFFLIPFYASDLLGWCSLYSSIFPVGNTASSCNHSLLHFTFYEKTF